MTNLLKTLAVGGLQMFSGGVGAADGVPSGASIASSGFSKSTGLKSMPARVTLGATEGFLNRTGAVNGALGALSEKTGAYMPGTPNGEVQTSAQGLGRSDVYGDQVQEQIGGATQQSIAAAWDQAINKKILDLATIAAEISGNMGKVAGKVQDAPA